MRLRSWYELTMKPRQLIYLRIHQMADLRIIISKEIIFPIFFFWKVWQTTMMGINSRLRQKRIPFALPQTGHSRIHMINGQRPAIIRTMEHFLIFNQQLAQIMNTCCHIHCMNQQGTI